MRIDQIRPARSRAQLRLGVVVSLDPEEGVLTLIHRDGSCSRLRADPSLPRDLRIGGPVLALIEGASLRGLRCL